MAPNHTFRTYKWQRNAKEVEKVEHSALTGGCNKNTYWTGFVILY